MKKQYPFISIIIPCRNEVNYISKVVDNIISQDYPGNLLEAIFVDGQSDDGTRDVIIANQKVHQNIILIENEQGTVSPALNLGIQKSKGDYIVRMDAHSVYPKNYISTLVAKAIEYSADNIGCVVETIPSNGTLMARSIAAALSSPFGVGNSLFRIGISAPQEVDTVPFGCFKREVFSKVGFFDTELVRNQDDEFNARLKLNGFRIILIPFLSVKYYSRDTIPKTIKMYYQYGLFKPLVNKKLGKPATGRQFFPPCLVLYLFSIPFSLFFATLLVFIPLIVYFLILIYGMVHQVMKDKGFKTYQLLLPLVFASIHISYGVGYLAGFWAIKTRYYKIFKINKTTR